MKNTIISLSLILLSVEAWALPSFQQVETEVQQGHYTQAEVMLAEVVESKPGSAKAHYIYAEVLAHNAKFVKASLEAKTARQIDPALKFTQPEKFRAFEQLLERELNPPVSKLRSAPALAAAPVAMAAPREPESAGIPGWVWGGALALIGVFLWRSFTRSRAAAASSNPYGTERMPVGTASQGFAAPATGVGPSGIGTPFGQPGAAAGNGLLGTGMAVAGGVAAGMLVDRMLHSNHGDSASGNYAQSGLLPGSFDTPQRTDVDLAAQELEQRPVDFGSGNDWDSSNGGDIATGDGGWD